MESEKVSTRIIWELLNLAVGAQCRANFAQLQVNDIVLTAIRCGATWEQVGKWLNLTPEEAEGRFADADGSITLDEDVVINLGYLAKKKGLPTFAAALRYVFDEVEVGETIARQILVATPTKA